MIAFCGENAVLPNSLPGQEIPCEAAKKSLQGAPKFPARIGQIE